MLLLEFEGGSKEGVQNGFGVEVDDGFSSGHGGGLSIVSGSVSSKCAASQVISVRVPWLSLPREHACRGGLQGSTFRRSATVFDGRLARDCDSAGYDGSQPTQSS